MAHEYEGNMINEFDSGEDHRSEVTDLLYGVVQWINGNPVLDGMRAFTTMAAALTEVNEWEKGQMPPGVDLTHTIIRIKRSI